MRTRLKKSLLRHLSATALLLATLVSCSVDADSTTPIVVPPTPPTPTPAVPVATTIDVTAPTAVLNAIGRILQLQATVRDRAGATMTGVAIAWTVRDTLVARISTTGQLTAVSNGSTVATATAAGIEGTFALQVKQQVVRIAVSPTSIQYSALNDSSEIVINCFDANGFVVTDAAVNFGSADGRVAAVSARGTVKAIGSGLTSISVTVDTIGASIPVQVAQIPSDLKLINTSSRTLTISESASLEAAVVDRNGFRIPTASVTWSSSNPAVVAIESGVVMRGLRAGVARVTATAVGITAPANIDINVVNSRVEAIPTSLATPAAGARWEIPVVIIRYIPTLDGRRVDSTETTIRGTPEDIRSRAAVLDERIKFMLEEGSKFRGYQDPSALPSIGYRVVHIVTFYAHFTKGREVPWNPGHFFPDYQQILAQVDARTWVEQHGVKEFWVWGYHSNNFEQPESNMSSPVTGDISNSSRFNDDLPVFSKTYTVYGYNYGRTQAEAVHVHGHQLEAILGHVDGTLFWRDFVGQDATNKFIVGRAGWTHMPPNTLVDYDYLNNRVEQSDIADWKPGGGRTASVSQNTWANLTYRWPTALTLGETSIWQKTESQWYMYWMQNMPGLGNTIPLFGGQMTNWWQFTGDWDAAIRGRVGLATVPNGLPIEIRNDFRGDIFLNPGGTLTPGKSVVLISPGPLGVSVYNCGHPGATACVMDPYTLVPGKKYRVVEHPNGPVNNLTIVESQT